MKPDSRDPFPRVGAESIEAAAATWLSLRDRGMTEAETAEFMRWMQRDVRHAEIFNALDRTWRAFDRSALIRPTRAAEPDAELLAPRPRPPRRRAGWARIALVAAAVAVTWLGMRALPEKPTAETAVGAFERLELEDGSVIQLNTDSAVRVRFSAGARHVDLVRGEAHFAVAKDPSRPFTVNAGHVAVRAVGTAFNVRVRDEAIEVLVTEGRVQVQDADKGSPLLGRSASGEPSLLVQGERAVLSNALASEAAPVPAVVATVPAAEMERALAWQERRLEFDATPLAVAVAEFNRYNQHKLVIADPRLVGREFGGSFRADGYDAFVRLLEENFEIRAEREPGRTVLRSRP